MQAADTYQASLPFHRRHKNAILLATLLLMILLAPLGELFEDSKLPNMILATIVMATSLNAISHRNRSTVYFAIGLATLAIIFGWIHVASGGRGVHQIPSLFFGAALYCYIAALLFKVILLEDEITVDQIFAAVTIYIFIGLAWGNFYALVDTFDPESIDGVSMVGDSSQIDFTYFSFVTLTTVGYGDILPLNPVTKVLVIVESVTGVMFVAVLVATLVGRVNMRR